MQIEERAVGDVMILDLKGKITLARVTSCSRTRSTASQPGPQEDRLEPGGRALHRQRGPREFVRTYTTVSRQGGSLKLPQSDEAHYGSPVDHEAFDRLRDVRVRERSGPEFSASAKV